jgi:hypothetical protein
MVAWHEVPGDRNERGTVPVGYRMTDPAGVAFWCARAGYMSNCDKALTKSNRPSGTGGIWRYTRHFVPGLRRAQSSRYHRFVPPGRTPYRSRFAHLRSAICYLLFA